jgi:16S rRNA (adenine1518-N6/adenine1519-N6)-dimethyltransferase
VLTAALLGGGASVVAVEVDVRLAGHLRSRFSDEIDAGALTLVEADVLDTPVAELAPAAASYDLVANLPYHITSPTLHHFLGAEPRPRRFVLMVQREVGERICAKPGAMSYLSVFVQYHAAVRVARIVPATAFEPAPEVESAVLAGEVRPRRLSAEAEDELWRLVQAGFRERRKMLHNVLPRQLPSVGRERFTGALAAVGIAADRRPQTVSVDEWLALAAVLGPLDATLA